MAESATAFTPSENQLKLLKVFQDADYDIKVTEACRAAKLDRASTYYQWMKNEAFATWWKDKAVEFFGRLLPGVYGALNTAATGGDPRRCVNHAAAKILLDRFDKGFLPASKIEHSGSVDMSEMTPEQLAARARVLLDGKEDRG